VADRLRIRDGDGDAPNRLYDWIKDREQFPSWRLQNPPSKPAHLLCVTGATRDVRTLALCGILNNIAGDASARGDMARSTAPTPFSVA
jgi:hypothetical protein